MLCDRPSLFTKRTREPMATSTFFGDVPVAVIVMVVVLTAGVVGAVGVLELPHAVARTIPAARAVLGAEGSRSITPFYAGGRPRCLDVLDFRRLKLKASGRRVTMPDVWPT